MGQGDWGGVLKSFPLFIPLTVGWVPGIHEKGWAGTFSLVLHTARNLRMASFIPQQRGSPSRCFYYWPPVKH
jgi:hypothetical protein